MMMRRGVPTWLVPIGSHNEYAAMAFLASTTPLTYFE